jgi:hypothetical protein
MGRQIIAAGLAALSLAACATTPSEPRIITKEVVLEVPVKCRPAITRPDLPDIETAIAAGDDFGLAQAYRAFWLRARPYIAQLEAAVKGCAG